MSQLRNKIDRAHAETCTAGRQLAIMLERGRVNRDALDNAIDALNRAHQFLIDVREIV